MSTIILGVDIGSTKICAIIAQKETNSTKILGAGISKSQGIKKGIVTNIELASRSIKHAINDAKRVAGTHFDKVVISISGAHAKSVISNGVVNIPNNEIGITEIKRVMEMANHNAHIPADYEKLHIIPSSFKVDDHEDVDDPLGMNGARLEVNTHIVIVLKSNLNNLKKAVKSASLEIDNIILNSYASSLAVLSEDEKELGVAMIDLGGATSNSALYIGGALKFSGFLGVGSNNITNDLSMALHTPINAASKVKTEYGSLKLNSADIINLPAIGDEGNSHEVSLEIVTNVIYARVEETLMLLAKSIKDSGFKDQLGAGVVLTGGMTRLEGLRDLSSAIFNNMPVRIAKPNGANIDGMFDTLKGPEYSTALGLILYGGGEFTPYEMDSNQKLRYKDEIIEPSGNIQDIIGSESEDSSLIADLDISTKTKKEAGDENNYDIFVEKDEDLKTGAKKFWNKITQMF